MINKIINIDVDYEAMGVPPSPRQTTLTTYILEQKNVNGSVWGKRPAIIICPGGGYGMTSEREAEPIALKYASAGFHAFVLDYSVYPSMWPSAITELSKAIMYVRKIADEYAIDADKIYVAGFSAGGHLAASIGVHYNHPDVVRYSETDGVINKPNGVILGYPVVTSNRTFSHEGSIYAVTGGDNALRSIMSIENYVTPETPEMFIFHTFSDEIVPVENSLLLADSLKKQGVRFELHIYPNGPHGVALANDVTSNDDSQNIFAIENWIDLSITWIKNISSENK